jgi:RHS repeat-associated protein
MSTLISTIPFARRFLLALRALIRGRSGPRPRVARPDEGLSACNRRCVIRKPHRATLRLMLGCLALLPLLPLSVAAQTVTPQGAEITRNAQTSGQVVPFTVTNNSGDTQWFSLSCQRTGAVTACSGPGSISIDAESSAEVEVTYGTGAAGTGTVELYVDHGLLDHGWYDVTVVAPPPPVPPTYTVLVTPDAQQITPAAFSQQTQSFTIQNTGTGAATYDLAVICSPPAATACSGPASVVLGAGASTIVNVGYQTGEVGLTGTIRLRASYREIPAVSDDGAVSITVAAGGPSSTIVSVTDANPGTSVDRDLCLTVAVGPAAAFECGDLRIVHGVPGVTTFNTTRAPTLLYNSRQAQATPILAALVTLASNAATPTHVTGALWVKPAGGGSWVNPPGATGDWAGAAFTAGQPTRIALSYDAAGTGVQLTDYRIDVTVWYGGTPQPVVSATSQFVLVDRSRSPFGAGWWLAGLDRLFFPLDGSIVWVGGDGSTRRYGSTGTSGVWAAQSVDRPDTLKWVGGSSRYVRYLPHGLTVNFDAAGLHRETVNRLTYTTRFAYDGSARLTKITVPQWQDTTRVFAITYHAADSVSIASPPVDGLPRVTTLRLIDTTVRLIRDADEDSVSFTYDPAPAHRRLNARIDRRGTRTRFVYTTGHGLESAILDSAPNKPWREHRFTPIAETRGLSTGVGQSEAAARADVYTKYDGPRVATDALDHLTVWTDRFGAPSKIENAVGGQTVLTRGDGRFPALVTEQRAPDGFTTWATYDARGNLVSSTEVQPLTNVTQVDPRNATTTYEWDTVWDFLKKVTLPEGEITAMGYDATTGNRLWQEDGRGAAGRTDYSYHAWYLGPAPGQLAAVTMPAGPNGIRARDTLRYDGAGNVALIRRATETADERVTRFTRDGIGRTIRTAIDITLGGSAQRRDSAVFDLMDRVLTTKSYSYNLAPAETLFTETAYDEEGNTRRVSRWSYPNTSGIGTITTRWGYDRANQVVADTAPDGKVERRTYDPAGNILTVTTRRGYVITSTYDAMNRLATRTVPSITYQDTLAGIAVRDNQPYPRRPNSGNDYLIGRDSAAFTYDPVGRLLTANNGDARVTRTYYNGGQLETEKQELRNAADSTFSHSYLLRYTYDLNRRRGAVKLPAQLVPADSRDSVAFAYDTLTGELRTVTDPLGNAFTYSYTHLGQPAALAYPGSYTQRWSYLLDGSLGRDSILNTGGTSGQRWPVATMRATRLEYDYQGKMVSSKDSMGFQDTVLTTYSGLGHLLTSAMSQNGQLVGAPISHRYWTREQQSYDALGNLTFAVTADTSTYNGIVQSAHRRTRSQTHAPGVGRLVLESGVDVDGTYVYDADGNLQFSMREAGQFDDPSEDRFTYYAADGRVRAADYRYLRNGQADETPQHWVFEEYRYDALGRRVWVRSYRDCAGYFWTSEQEVLECRLSTLRRTVWDGEQELIEIQVPGAATQSSVDLENDDYLPRMDYLDSMDPNPHFGRVVYVHGLSLDQPIALTRYRYVDHYWGRPFTDFPTITMSLFWNARGQLGLVACANGNRLCQHNGYDMWVDYSQLWFAYDRGKFVKRSFLGTLIHDKQDGVQTLYRRNRYYDPATGRFTQEDPIGLAGGLNLYGYAGGDPVNYSDPFGLFPCCLIAQAGHGAMVGAYERAFTAIFEEQLQETEKQLAVALISAATLYVGSMPAAGYSGVARSRPASSMAGASDDVVRLYHQGNLSGGVSGTRTLSTSTSPALTHYHPEGQLYEFQVPKMTFYEWLRRGQASPATDLHLPSGTVTPEIRILPPTSGEMNRYLRPPGG